MMIALKPMRRLSCTPLAAVSATWNPKCRSLAWPVAGSKQPPPKACVHNQASHLIVYVVHL